MDKPMLDDLAQRLENLERENRRWKFVAGVGALGVTLLLMLGFLLGTRAVVAQLPERQPEKKVGNPALFEYKVVDHVHLGLMEKPLEDLAAEGWEVVQVVPTHWTTAAQVGPGNFTDCFVLARRPRLHGR
jgi:hypothetical protein